jgi:carbamoyltransferase
MLVVGVNEGLTQDGKSLRDGSCVIIRDGSIVQAISEERVTRQKHAGGYKASFSLLCSHLGLRAKDIDLIVTSSCCEAQPSPKFSVAGYEGVSVDSCNHHLSHACSSFFSAPFDKAIVIVLDAGGNTLDLNHALPWWERKREQHSCYLVTKNSVELIRQDFVNPKETGIGELYRAFTYYLGWSSSRFASNTMALAGLGEKSHLSGHNIFQNTNGRQTSIVENNPLAPLEMVNQLLTHFDINIPHREKDEPFHQMHIDLAAWLQYEVECALVDLTDSLIQDFGVKNICLSGGVAYNCKAVSSIIKRSKANQVFVSPVSGDHGQALGNAIYGYRKLVPNKKFSLYPFSPYLGPDHDTSYNNIVQSIDDLDLPLLVKESKDVIEETAQLLSNGSILGWFQNRGEFGPRALGNRSICASPVLDNIKDRLNKIKNRELFMPIAPAVLEKNISQYFNKGGSQYMTAVVDIKNLSTELGTNVAHADGTARIQIVNRNGNTKFYELINAFYKKTDIPMMFNTSFNGNGEPLVETVYDALECFYKLALDYLIIGDSVVSKKNAARTVGVKVQDITRDDILLDEIWETIQEIIPNIAGMKRTRFLLFDKYIQWVKEGKKKTTIRYRRDSIDYPADISLPVLETDDFSRQYVKMVGRAIIQRIEIKQFGQLSEKNAYNDGFSSLNELKNTLQEIYGKIGARDFVTIYTFHFVNYPKNTISC